MSLPVLSYATAKADPAAFIQQLQLALLTTGFFYLSDVEQVVPEWQQAWDDAFRSSAEFFAHPLETKKEIGMPASRHFRGYSAYGVEVTQGKHDLREQIDLGPDTEPAVDYPPPPEQPIELCLYGPNQYPPFTPSLEPAIRKWRSLSEIISQDLVSLMAQSLTPHPELLTSLFDSTTNPSQPPYSRMKVVQYPPVRAGDEGLGVGAHRDGGGITLLAQDQTGGLQVQLFDGQWIDATPIPYALVINVGQVIERVSNGLYAATTHRVLPTRSSTPRLSIPFFFCPTLRSRVPVLSRSQIHPALLALAAKTEGKAVVSDVRDGDLHEEVFGRAAWRGITRSHGDVWAKYYGREVDPIGGPEQL
ncbi:hypothetical protein Rhopal_002552-T1 [Rhodotorula paludigena]|uniref:Fe2OG dioxygenase domain-containing protein n=1 Tax=Rhodotorula paludigena TaxID=86838 RepID=A0AAV5GJA1_9BASI|nr:hypothetical protein Rhopal_002552-T1 [Rhodotorula paludigena]